MVRGFMSRIKGLNIMIISMKETICWTSYWSIYYQRGVYANEFFLFFHYQINNKKGDIIMPVGLLTKEILRQFANVNQTAAIEQQVKALNVPTGAIKVGHLNPGYIFRQGAFGVSAENPTMLWNHIRAYDGAVITVVESNTATTLSASQYTRAILWTSLDSIVSAKITDNTPETVTFLRLQETTYMTASNHFVVIPFVALLENGQTITTTESTSGEMDSLVASACGAGTRIIFFGPAISSRPYYDSGVKFRATLNLNLDEYANLYARHIEQFQIESKPSSILALKVGMVFCAVPTTTISYQDSVVTVTKTKPREMLF